MPGVCGHFSCTPKTCAELGANCGPVGDGCGNVLQCGDCTGGDTCGGGGTPSVCGQGSSCTPKSCAAQAVNCGLVGDGCGNVHPVRQLHRATETCGGGGIPNVCGAPPCTPKTCAQLGALRPGRRRLRRPHPVRRVQPAADLRRRRRPSLCGTPASCTNLCLKQVTCADPNVTTTVTGTVYAPNGVDPLLNALVYVPNAAVQPFPAGVSCEQCGAGRLRDRRWSRAVDGVDGKFTLKNVPVGANIPLVIQLGRWRRQVTIPNVASCTSTPVAAALTRLPKNKAEGDIPLMAFSTGAVDALECVMRKIGVDDSEFTAAERQRAHPPLHGPTDHSSTYPTTNVAGVARGEIARGGSARSSQATLNKYDMVLFPARPTRPARRLRSAPALPEPGRTTPTRAAASSPRTTATCGSTRAARSSSSEDQTGTSSSRRRAPIQNGFINTTFPKGQALAQWLGERGRVDDARADARQGDPPRPPTRVAPSQTWMHATNPCAIPRALHVQHARRHAGRAAVRARAVRRLPRRRRGVLRATFPAECPSGAMTPQQKLLEFMIFDLGSCVTPDIPACTPKTCAELGVNCGLAGDGCGGAHLSAATCTAPADLRRRRRAQRVRHPNCTPKTCAQLGIRVRPGRRRLRRRPPVRHAAPRARPAAAAYAGHLRQPGPARRRPAPSCGIQCGPAGDGCGSLIQCGSCPAGQTCGGGGMSGVCGAPTCTPKTCAQLGANCGPLADGCGGILQCGHLPDPADLRRRRHAERLRWQRPGLTSAPRPSHALPCSARGTVSWLSRGEGASRRRRRMVRAP